MRVARVANPCREREGSALASLAQQSQAVESDDDGAAFVEDDGEPEGDDACEGCEAGEDDGDEC